MASPKRTASGSLRRRVIIVLAASLLWAVCGSALAQEPPDAHIIKIDGVITQAYAKAVQRKIEFADQHGVRTIILELDTPGGTIGDSKDLADFVFQRDHLDIIAYINKDALSGGTMVALACKEIYIDEVLGTMGDVAPIGPGGEIVGEKIQTVVRERMATYARARGYPEALVKGMVTKEIEVWRVQMQDEPEGTYTYLTSSQLDAMSDEEAAKVVSRTFIVPAGELLTMDAQRAVEYGFAKKAVKNARELYEELGLDPSNVERLYLTGSERVLTFLDVFSPFLIVAGFVLLFMELSHPGFGLPGILGIGCFVVFFIVKYTLHYARMLEILLFVVGLILVLVEMLVIPGFGFVGAAGIALLFVSLVLAFQQFGWPATVGQKFAFKYSLLKVTGSFAGAGVAIVLLVRYLPYLPLLGRIVHRHDLAAAHAGEFGELRTPGLSEMIGQAGVALTALRPAGRAEFGDRLLDVVTEGGFVEKGARVQILEIRGNTVVVKPHSET